MIPAISRCLFLLLATLPSVPPEGTGVCANGLVTVRIEDRIIKSFDFNEQPLGNFESMPINWRPIWMTGYPRFLVPRFDAGIGHDAPPSVLFTIAGGGSVGAFYLAKDIHIHPGCDYEVTGWIRPKGLVHAAASISAYYLDHALNPISESVRTSEVVRGPHENEPWQQVRIHLPSGFARARWLGLSCRVEQSRGGDAKEPPHAIHYHDARGAAWFDDIRVLRLPRATLRMKEPGAVIFADRRVDCVAAVLDLDGAGIEASLEILDADGLVVAKREPPILPIEAEAAHVQFDPLPPGLYTARLVVTESDREVIHREQSFICLHRDEPSGPRGAGQRTKPDDPGSSKAAGELHRGFGLILDADSAAHRAEVEPLLSALAPELIKLPLWRKGLDDRAVVYGDKDAVALARFLKDRGIGFVGVLESPPASLAMSLEKPEQSVYEVLSGPTKTWQPYLGFVLTRFGGQSRAWQIGADAKELPANSAKIAPAFDNVRSELKPLFGTAALAAPRPVDRNIPTTQPDAEIESLIAAEHIPAGQVLDYVAGDRSSAAAKWLTIQPHDEAGHDRLARLSDLARRIVLGLQGGARTVFLPQPWRFTLLGQDASLVPSEDAIIFHTLSKYLSETSPAGRVWLAPDVEAYLFDGGRSGPSAIVAWRRGESSDAEDVRMGACPQGRQVDLWGNTNEPTRDCDGALFPIGAMPVIISPVIAEQIRLFAGFRVESNELRIATAPQRRTICLKNTLSKRFTGKLRLAAPPSWRIQPDEFTIEAGPGEERRLEITLRLPRNVAVDEYVLFGRLFYDDPTPVEMQLRAPMAVRTPELDVNVLSRRDGGDLLVFQRITNRAAAPVTLRASLVCPSETIQAQLVRGLGAGETAVREYRFSNASRLAGRTLRSCVEQIDGAISHNILMRCE